MDGHVHVYMCRSFFLGGGGGGGGRLYIYLPPQRRVCHNATAGTPCPWGGMKCIFSGTSIGMPGNDAL